MRIAILALVSMLTVAACGIGRFEGGGAAPVSGRVCDRVPASMCQDYLDAAMRDGPPGSGGVAGIHVRCDVAECTEAAGEASVVVTYANGYTNAYGTGWAGPMPAEPGNGAPGGPVALPVEPTCLGVPWAWCREMARSAIEGLERDAPPVSIVVRCRDACGLEHGEGETVTTLDDGTEYTSSWGYSGPPPPMDPQVP
jgi:hypothetical protein